MLLDFSDNGRRPSTAQIIKRWKDAGRPDSFTVEYGETYAEFQILPVYGWDAHGNGCQGFNRDAVLRALKGGA